ncbi:DUF1905 domain-containing protein [bacterium]|nr:DUF1905 domain-containing protein [bacterium]
MKYQTTIVQTGNNTGIHVPDEILEKLNGGKRPLVKVTLNGYTYRSAVGKMGGKFMISLSAENRKNANVKGGDTLEVSIVLDTEPRTIDVPLALQAALDENKDAKDAFEILAPSKKKALVLSVVDAKTEETMIRRIAKIIDSLK